MIDYGENKEQKVTILILIDGFLQYVFIDMMNTLKLGHNPYFNRWFSAIGELFFLDDANQSHNPYFNRWFSAMIKNVIY